MDNSQASIFQLLTRIEQILKTYQQNNNEIEQMVMIFKQLQQLKLSSEMTFQQLVPNNDKLIGLKLTLQKQILRMNSRFFWKGMEIEGLKQIKYDQDTFLNLQQIDEIQRKISAIKGEVIFVNQELSIQTLEKKLDGQATNIDHISLRKLIKEYIKKCKSTSRLPFLTPLCIRLVVLQQSIMTYLQKSMKIFCSILNSGNDFALEEQRTTLRSTKSISSLSASIQHFLQNQNKNSPEEVIKTSFEVEECRSFRPVIKSDFIFERVPIQRPYAAVNHDLRRNNCCMWF